MSEEKLFLTSWPSGKLIPVKVLEKSGKDRFYIEYEDGGHDTTRAEFLYDIPDSIKTKITTLENALDMCSHGLVVYCSFGSNKIAKTQAKHYRSIANNKDKG